jgi:hypothetical protein
MLAAVAAIGIAVAACGSGSTSTAGHAGVLRADAAAARNGIGDCSRV